MWCALRHLQDGWAPDAAEWRAILAPVVASGGTWLSAPWWVWEGVREWPTTPLIAPLLHTFLISPHLLHIVHVT